MKGIAIMKHYYSVLGYPPHDRRLDVSRHTNSIFPITRFASREEVEQRREELRFNLRMAAGLYPWPEKTPLHTKYEDVGTFDGYSVKKIMFESRPGFWSTGNLYLPHPMKEKMPAILNVIGHWEEQRLTREDTADYPAQLANFARMGFVCLVTDMIGKVDSLQITHDYGREEKELYTSNGLGIQLWNNIRALDLLCELPYVDAEKIGMTGASGGGSQTLFLALLDERVRAAAPINMISLHMQGGCQCENAEGLRRHTDNTEMCAMIAPRPLFLAGSTGDWTRWLETDELPGVLEAYRQYDAEELVEYFYQDAPHQYNEKTRHHVYSFFARHLMGEDPHWEEQSIETGDLSAYTWYAGNGHAPGITSDAEFFAYHKAERIAAIAALSDEEKRRMLSWMTGLGCTGSRYVQLSAVTSDGICIKRGVLVGCHGEKLPVVTLIPENWDGNRICLALSSEGKECLADENLQTMLADGTALISADLYLTGEFADCVQVDAVNDANNRYFSTFHDTTDACRVQDTARLIRYAKTLAGEVMIHASGCGARAAVCALALCDGVSSAELEETAISLTTDDAYYSEFLIPGICAFGGLTACLGLAKCPITLY